MWDVLKMIHKCSIQFIFLGFLSLLPSIFHSAVAKDINIRLPIRGAIASLAQIDGHFVITTKNQKVFTLNYNKDSFFLAPTQARPPPPKKADMLPDGAIAKGKHNIKAAWYSHPTGRYRHGILGDAIEAARLVIEDNQGKIWKLHLPDSKVFEDITPRIADPDNDGEDEVIVILSDVHKGSSLGIVELTGGGLLITMTPPIGMAHRWLNPAGIDDYNGDGLNEIAIVRTPHIGGDLVFYRYNAGQITQLSSLYGFSNHGIGMRAQGLSLSYDQNKDGIMELILPDDRRQSLQIVSHKNGKPLVISEITHSSRVITNIFISDFNADGKMEIISGHADGNLWITTLPTDMIY
jgi:hypothetical protein